MKREAPRRQCANPDCDEQIDAPAASPQSKIFCSTHCRMHAAYLRRKAKERLGEGLMEGGEADKKEKFNEAK